MKQEINLFSLHEEAEARPTQGVGLIIELPEIPLIYTITEGEDKPKLGKRPGDQSFPMETVHTWEGETKQEALLRALEEENDENMSVQIAGKLGTYLIGTTAAIDVYRYLVTYKNGKKPNFVFTDIRDAKWMDPRELISGRMQIREGVFEAITDYLAGRRIDVIQCKPSPFRQAA